MKSVSEKTSAFNSKIEEKYPTLHRKTSVTCSYIKEVWQETFPNPDGRVKSKMQTRKEIATKLKMQEQLSPEELEALEGQIPEWKKGALVMTDEKPIEETPSLFKRLKNKVVSKAADTKVVKNFKESEEYKRIEEVRKEMQEFKHNLKDEIDSTQNPIVQTTRSMTDLVFMESTCAKAIKEM